MQRWQDNRQWVGAYVAADEREDGATFVDEVAGVGEEMEKTAVIGLRQPKARLWLNVCRVNQ
jgi:hypothetical protein